MASVEHAQPQDLQTDKPTPVLKLQKENVIPYAINLDLISYSPTMDLIALVTQDGQFEVWRLSGQRASKISRPSGAMNGSYICWKHDGKLVKLMRSNGKAELLNLDTTHCLYDEVPRSPTGNPTTSEWTCHYVNGASKVQRDFMDQMSSRISLEESNKRRTDWPRSVALLDVTRSMPGLSALPHVDLRSVQGDLGTTMSFEIQRDVDEMLNTPFLPADVAEFDIHLEFWDDGFVSILIGESTVCGRVKVSRHGHVVKHVSHPLVSSRGLLLHKSASGQSENSSKGDRMYHLLNFNSVHQSGDYYMLAMSKYQQMLRISSYITNSIMCLSSAWEAAQDLPAKFIRNVNETLAEKNEGDIVTGLFHSAVTGDWWPVIREWLVEELTERGRSRWSVSVASGYSMITRVAHENLLPALDRMAIIISRLRTLSRVKPPIPFLQIDETIFQRIMDQLQVIRILGHQVLIYAAGEARQFKVFSEWLQIQIPLLAAESESAGAEEAAEKAANLDHAQLLSYIGGPMLKSRLDLLLYAENLKEFETSFALPEESLSNLPAILKRHKSKPIPREHANMICNMPAQAVAFPSLVLPLTNRIRQSFSDGALISDGLILGLSSDTDCFDMRMVHESREESANTAMTYIASVEMSRHCTILIDRIPHIEHLQETGSYTHQILPHQAISLHLDTGPDSTPLRILDLKFIDDTRLMALIQTQNSSHLLEITYNATSGIANSLTVDWTTVPLATKPNNENLRTTFRVYQPQHVSRESFDHPNGVGAFVPAKIVVSGGDQMRKVVVFEQDARRWRVYGLDHAENMEDSKF